MKMLSRLSVLWKVLLAPAIAMLCMAVYLTFTAVVFEKNNLRLADVRDVQYPVLDAMTENTGALDKIIDVLNSASTQGEPEQIAAADALAAKVAENYRRLRKLDGAHGADLDRLAGEFDRYYKTAREISAAIAQQSGLPAKERLQAMAAELATYRKDVADFRTAARDRFVGTVHVRIRTLAGDERAVVHVVAIGKRFTCSDEARGFALGNQVATGKAK